MAEEPITLYGTPLSLYTGKARSYLIKNGLIYREVAPSTSRYLENVVPRAGGISMPTVETADGIVVRDGTEIAEYFESRMGHPSTPPGPRQQVVSALLDVIGMEGLLRPAMHYRWSFPDENHDFLSFHFASIVPAGLDQTEVAGKGMERMRQAAMAFGVVPESIDGIEARYLALLSALDRHFSKFPYLLGGRPSLGDFGLIAPMYGHLGRDPKPLSVLQAKAIRVFRWVERMNRPEPDRGEYVAEGEEPFGDDFLPNDEIPETLVAVLQQMAVDFVPETLAAADHINAWLDERPDLAAGTKVERGVGLAHFEVEGEGLHGLAQPHRFYLLGRAQAAFDALSPPDRSRVEQTLDQCGLRSALDARLSRGIRFQDNVEVWE